MPITVARLTWHEGLHVGNRRLIFAANLPGCIKLRNDLRHVFGLRTQAQDINFQGLQGGHVARQIVDML